MLSSLSSRRPLWITLALALVAAACLLLQWSRPAGRGRLLALAGPAVNWEDGGRFAQPTALAAWSLRRKAPLVAADPAELAEVEQALGLWTGTRRSFSSPAFPGLLFPLQTLPADAAVQALAGLARLAALVLPLLVWLVLPPITPGWGVRSDPLIAALLVGGTGAFTHATVGGSPALIAACLACGGLGALLRGRDLLAGALLGAAALVSECLLAVPLALALAGCWRAWSAAVVALAAGAALGLGFGGWEVWLRWFPAVLAAWGDALRAEPLRWLALAAGGVLLLWAAMRRNRIRAEAVAAVAVVAGLLASPLRDMADGVLLLPAAAVLLRGIGEGPCRVAAGALLALAGAMVTGASGDALFRVLHGLALAAVGGMLVLAPGTPASLVCAGRVPAIVLLATVAGMVGFAGFVATTVVGERSLAGLSVVYVLLVAATMGVGRRAQDAPRDALLPPRWGGVAMVAGLAGLVGWMLGRAGGEVAATPVFYHRADMLPLVQQVARALLDGTGSVYGPFFELGAWGYQCTYWPGLWLPFVAVEAHGLDLRVLTLGAMAVLPLLLAWVSGAFRRGAAGDLGVVLTIALLFAAGPLALASTRVQTAPVWLALTALLAGVARQRPALAAVAAGCLATARFPMLGLLPITGIAVWRMGRPEAFRQYALLAALPAVVLLGPLALADPKEFVLSTLVRQIALHQDLGRDAAPFLGLAAVAQALGGELPGAALLALGMVAVAAAQWFLARSPGDHLLAIAAYVGVFCLVTPVPFFYYHVKLLLALTAVVLWRPDPENGAVPEPWRWRAVLAVAAVAGATFATLRDWPGNAVLRRSPNHIDAPELSLMGFRTTGEFAPLLEEAEGAIGFTARGARAGTLLVRFERLDRGPEGFAAMRWNQRPVPGIMTPVEGPFELAIALSASDLVRGVNTLIVSFRNPDGTPMVGNIRLRNARWEPGPP